MAFNAGAIIGRIFLDNSQYKKSATQVGAANKGMMASGKMLGLGFAAIGAAAVAGIGIAVKKADAFNKAFSNVTTLVDTAVVSTIKMKNELLRLDSRLGSATELTEGLYQALSASVEPAAAVKFVGEAAIFAKAALVDTASSVDVLTTVLNAYGLEATETAHVSDVLFSTIKKGKVTGQELAASIGVVIPAASQLNVGIEELGSAIAIMTKKGTNSARATTQLSALFTSFLKPTNAMSRALEEAGFESGEMLLKTEGLAGALEFLEEAAGGSLAKTTGLLGNIRATRAASSLSGAAIDEFKDIVEEMGFATGVTEEAFKKQRLTFETFSNTVDKVAIRVGQVFLPVLDQVIDGVSDFINSAEGFDLVGDIVARVSSGFSVFSDVVAKIVTIYGSAFGKLISTFVNRFQELSSTVGVNIDFFDVLTTALNIVGMAVKTVSNFDAILINTLFDLINVGMAFGRTFVAAFNFVIERAGVFQGALTEMFGDFKDKAEPLQNVFTKVFTFVFDKFKIVAKAFQIVFDFIVNKINQIAGVFKPVFDFVSDKIIALGNVFTGVFDFILEKAKIVGDIFKKIFDVVLGKSKFKDLKKSFAELGDAFADVGAGMKDGATVLVTDITDDFKNMGSGIEETSRSLEKTFTDSLKNIKENYKDMGNEAGIVNEEIVGGMVNKVPLILKSFEAIEDEIPTLAEKWAETWNEMRNSQQEAWDGMDLDAKIKHVGNKFSEIAGFATQVFNQVADVITSFMDEDIKQLEAHNNRKEQATINSNEKQVEEFETQTEVLQEDLQERYDQGLLTEEEFNAEKLILEETRADDKVTLEQLLSDRLAEQKKAATVKENTAKKKAFETDKAFAIANIWINTAMAIIGFWAAYASIPIAGPIIAGVMTGVVTGLAIAQTVAVATRQFVPAMATGGIVGETVSDGSSMILQNELGGELAIHPDGTVIIPNDISQEIAKSGNGKGNGGKITNNFNIGSVRNENDINKIANKVSMILGRQLKGV